MTTLNQSEREYGISAVTLLPEALSWIRGPQHLARFCQAFGFKVQLVPFCGYDPDHLAVLPSQHVLSFEGSWYEEGYQRTLLETLKKIYRRRDWPALLCPLLFGSPDRARATVRHFRALYPEAYAIDAGQLDDLVETQVDGRFLDATEVVFDTWHIREHWPERHRLFKHIDYWLGEKDSRIRMIHVQTRDKREYHAFLTGEPCPLLRILKHLRPWISEMTPVVIELPPQWFLSLRYDWQALGRTLQEFRNRISRTLAED